MQTFMREATQIVYNMIGCAYLQTSKYLRRDRYVFVLSLSYEIKEKLILFSSELNTRITPFGYYFGVFAEMLNNGQIDEIAYYINSLPRINSRQAAENLLFLIEYLE